MSSPWLWIFDRREVDPLLGCIFFLHGLLTPHAKKFGGNVEALEELVTSGKGLLYLGYTWVDLVLSRLSKLSRASQDASKAVKAI